PVLPDGAPPLTRELLNRRPLAADSSLSIPDAPSAPPPSDDRRRLSPADLEVVRRLTEQNVPGPLLSAVIESMIHAGEGTTPPANTGTQGGGSSPTGRRMEPTTDREREDAPPEYAALSDWDLIP